jgi:type VI secretion system secreted protein Hcp
MKRKLALGVALAALVLGGYTTYSWAAGSAETQTINGCVDAKGTLRLVAVPGSCAAKEDAVSWNTTGPVGPQGLQGPSGPQGPAAPNPDAAAGSLDITAPAVGTFDTINLLGVNHGIVSPRDVASGQATGKRQHKPFVIVKQIDKSSPLLLKAQIDNRTLTSVLVGLNQGGAKVMTVKMTNAAITGYDVHGTTETWTFTYQKIEWTWLDGGITVQDDLNDRT